MATTPYPFVANAVLTASQLNSTYNVPVSTKTANYTLVAADGGTRVTMNSASATTITVNTSLFSAGDSVWIQNIGAGVCTITAGTATVTTAGSLALAANAGGTLYFTSASAAIFFASGVTSKVAQVLSTTLTTAFTSTSQTFTGVTGLSVSITPSATSSKIYVITTFIGTNDVGVTAAFFQLQRGSTAIGIGTGGTTNYGGSLYQSGTGILQGTAMSVLDSPSSTSALTYQVFGRNGDPGTFYINRSKGNANEIYASTITVMEILA